MEMNIKFGIINLQFQNYGIYGPINMKQLPVI